MENLSTDELLKRLRSSRSISQLNEYTAALSDQPSYHTFAEYMTAYLNRQQLSESEVIKASLIPRTYAYQILNGTKNPGREKVIALCLAAGMDYKETQRALALAGQGKLYPRRKEDSVIIFAIEQRLSVQQTNELLYQECGITL